MTSWLKPTTLSITPWVTDDRTTGNTWYKHLPLIEIYLKEITEDIPRFGPLNINDQLSSYSCSCESGDSKGMYRNLNSNRIFIYLIRHHRISKGV